MLSVTHTHMHTHNTHTHTHTHTHTCTIHTHTHAHTQYVHIFLLHCIQTAFPYSCVIYDESLCNSVFGQANITASSAQDTLLAAIELFSAVQDQDCRNIGVFLGCLDTFSPCPGSAWCGANSRDELRSAVSSACRCDRADSCVVNGLNTTAEDILIAAINRSLSNYYVGSSSTGPVGDSNAVCQDVTGKRHNLHACSLHCVVHGGAGRVYTVVCGGSILYLCGGRSGIFIDFTLFGHLSI